MRIFCMFVCVRPGNFLVTSLFVPVCVCVCESVIVFLLLLPFCLPHGTMEKGEAP